MNPMYNRFLQSLSERIISGSSNGISEDEAMILVRLPDTQIMDLLLAAHKITAAFKQENIFTCTIINAKSGRCSQDCAFCAQSSHYQTGAPVYPLMTKTEMFAQALEMEKIGATHFSMVTSGYRLNDAEIEVICETTVKIRQKTNLVVCCSPGIISRHQAKRLHESGVTHYHHNLETAPSYYDHICTTRAYSENIDSLKIAADTGLAICSGCIFGLGESWEQRVELGFTLKNLSVPRIPINFLNPIPGTKLQHMRLLQPFEALKCIALMRIIHPQADITICGGRDVTLKDYQSWVFMAGANGLMIGNYLTTQGRNLSKDLEMIREWQRLRKR